MHMNKLYYLSFVITFFVAFSACNDDDDGDLDMEVYATYSGVTKAMTSGDSLTFMVEDTLTLTIGDGVAVEGSAAGDYVVISSENLNVKTAQGSENTYLITANETGKAKVAIEDGSGEPHLILNINVVNEIVNYNVSESYTDIDVGDEKLKEDIENEVSKDFLPSTSKYILEYLKYDDPKEGLLGIVVPELYGSKDTITGTFTEKTISGETHVIMQYNDQTVDFKYEEDPTKNLPFANLTEDLTEKYQEEYPNQEISKVHTITSVYVTRESYWDLDL